MNRKQHQMLVDGTFPRWRSRWVGRRGMLDLNFALGLLTLCLSISYSRIASADEVVRLTLPKVEGMTRAEIYGLPLLGSSAGVLVLCPGCNGNGEVLVRSPEWQKFARANKLTLVGLSFASEISSLKDGSGYYYAAKGSGQALLDGIERLNVKNLPILLYGFSGGAHFVSRFVEWNAQPVIAWCAYSAAWWDEPKLLASSPPGIVACGDFDPRLGASMTYFKQGRAIGKPWLWINVAKTSHSVDARVDNFTRRYFASILSERPDPLKEGVWVDVDLKSALSRDAAMQQPSLSAWLPHSSLLNDWREVHGEQ